MGSKRCLAYLNSVERVFPQGGSLRDASRLLGNSSTVVTGFRICSELSCGKVIDGGDVILTIWAEAVVIDPFVYGVFL